MKLKWLDSIVRISSSDPNGKGYGTGFVIHGDEHNTYVVTCAHVIHAVGGSEMLLVDDIQAEVIVSGSEEDLDLAILRVKKLQGKLELSLCTFSKEQDKCIIPGFYSLNVSGNSRIEFKPLYGMLIKQGAAGRKISDLVDIWYVKVTDDDQLEPGYSGSPVIDAATGLVIGIISIRHKTQNGSKQGEAISVEALRKVWPGVPSSVFNQEWLNLSPLFKKEELLESLSSIITEIDLTGNDLEEVFYSCVPEDLLSTDKWLFPRNSITSKLTLPLLHKLIDAPISNGTVPPLLIFAEHLRKRSKNSSAKLREWIDDASKIWNVSLEELIALRKKLEKESSLLFTSISTLQYVLMAIEVKDKDKPNALSVKAWLCDQDGNEWVNLHSSDDVYYLDLPSTSEWSISKLIDRLLDDVGEYNRRRRIVGAKQIFEFFLSDELLCSGLAFDSVEIDEGSVPLGCRNVVVMRSLGRIKVNAMRNRNMWERRWNVVSNFAHSTDVRLIHSVSHSTECDWKKIYAKLISDELLICFCLLLSPLHIDIDHQKKIFNMVLKAGIPIALWPRNLADEPEEVQKFQQKLSFFLSNHELFDLPNLMLEHRLDAWQSNSRHHLGAYLTLLWDDPNRVPPQDKLEEMAVRM